MDLAILADAAAAAYVTGIAGHAAAGTDGVIQARFGQLRQYLASRLTGEHELEDAEEANLSASLLQVLEADPTSVSELQEILKGISDSAAIEGAGTVYGNVTLRGKYVAGRDIRFDGR
ncbi:hypothetical protein [Streptomyces sp. NPDC059874]|uniref:hypothetical protein n=1 Tax=Streptomyces sp. NPDC059874 TaxID=3346983 RepID=UPI0036499350